MVWANNSRACAVDRKAVNGVEVAVAGMPDPSGTVSAIGRRANVRDPSRNTDDDRCLMHAVDVVHRLLTAHVAPVG